MADVTLSSIERRYDGLHIFGTNFTQTTTVVAVDNVVVDATHRSSTELVIADAPAGASVTVTKGDVTAGPIVLSEDGGTLDPETPAAPTAPETPAGIGGSLGNTGLAPISAEDTMREQEKTPAPASEPAPDPVKAEVLKIGAQEPYPTGNPPKAPDEPYRSPDQPRSTEPYPSTEPYRSTPVKDNDPVEDPDVVRRRVPKEGF